VGGGEVLEEYMVAVVWAKLCKMNIEPKATRKERARRGEERRRRGEGDL
jgi:hypothetical protein